MHGDRSSASLAPTVCPPDPSLPCPFLPQGLIAGFLPPILSPPIFCLVGTGVPCLVLGEGSGIVIDCILSRGPMFLPLWSASFQCHGVGLSPNLQGRLGMGRYCHVATRPPDAGLLWPRAAEPQREELLGASLLSGRKPHLSVCLFLHLRDCSAFRCSVVVCLPLGRAGQGKAGTTCVYWFYPQSPSLNQQNVHMFIRMVLKYVCIRG